MLSVRSRYRAVEAASVQDRLHSLSNRSGLILDGGEDGNDAPPDDFFPLLVFLELFLLPFFAIFFCSCFQSNPSNSAGLDWSNSDPLPPPAFPVSDGDDGENELVANAALPRSAAAIDGSYDPPMPPMPPLPPLFPLYPILNALFMAPPLPTRLLMEPTVAASPPPPPPLNSCDISA